jgi:hypothetical protein
MSAPSQSVGQPKGRQEGNGLTPQQLIDALRDQTPEPIKGWYVEVGGRHFPLVQAWECVTNQPRSRYKPDKATRLFEQLGFLPFHLRRPWMNRPTEQNDVGAAAPREPAPVQQVAPQPQGSDMDRAALLERVSTLTAERDWLRERVERAESEREHLNTLLSNAQQALVRALQVAPQPVASSEAPDPSEQAPEPLQVIGSLTIDRAHCIATVGGEPISLTATEYQLLCALAEPPNSVHLSTNLARRVWGDPSRANGRSLPVHIRRIRGKLKAGGRRGPELMVVRGVGYLLNTLTHEE